MSPAAPAPGPEAPWALPAVAVERALETSTAQGLGPREVAARLARYGPNRLRAVAGRPWWRILWAQLRNFLTALLVVAAGLSFAVGEIAEGVAILGVIVVNVAIGFVTELRAVRSMEALRRLGDVPATVLREGRTVVIGAEELVPGDIVVIEAGDVVTADARLAEIAALEIDESALTGESVPVPKDPAPVAADAPLADRVGMIFKGTAVTRGRGIGIVTGTGAATEVGRIAALVDDGGGDETTPLERQLDAFGRRLGVGALAFSALLVLVGLLGGRAPVLVLETAIALAVATVPEGLPIVATIALARGMWRMASRHAVVRRLAAVETLGSTSVVLTDKTGTLTENRMSLVRVAVSAGDLDLPAGLVADPREEMVGPLLDVAVLCNDASVAAGGLGPGVGDPLELALLEGAVAHGVHVDDLRRRWPRGREVPFEAATRRMATFHADQDAWRIAVKGAPEAVVAAATRVATPEGPGPLDAAGWMARADGLAAEGLRVLALARGRTDTLEADPYEDLELLGLVALRDPPRPGVAAAIADCRAAGVELIMVTGDHAATARAIGTLVGIEGELVTGADLAATDDEAARERLARARIVARASPEDKLRLVELHQARGAVVAVLGDGVNDAPALRRADIGVAMGRRGTRIAREASDMVLEDDELATVVVAIAQGRVILGNIRRFVMYLLGCNLSEIATIGGAFLAGAPLPLLPLQILFLNLVTDVFPALALGVSEGSPGVMQRPPRPRDEPLLARSHWLAVIGHAAALSGAVLAGFAVALWGLELPTETAVTISFMILAVGQLLHVFDMGAPGTRFLRDDVVRNPWIWAALATCVALLVLAFRVPTLRELLALRDPGEVGWWLIAVGAVVPVAVIQLARRARRGRDG